MTDSDERELVREALGGNQRAFRTLLERHHALIYSVVRGIAGARGETDDIVQEVFIKIFRGLGDFRGDARLSTWIYRVARNEAINAAAKRRPSAVPIADCEDVPSEGEDPESIHRRSITRKRLEGCMMRLDENHRVALELRYMGEKSYEEIAEIMDIPLGTVKTHIHRAKLSLKRMLAAPGAETIEKGPGEP